MSGTTEKTRLIRPPRGGEITIPVEFRKSLGFDENTILRMTLKDGGLRITPVRAEEPRKGSPGLRALYEHFAPFGKKLRLWDSRGKSYMPTLTRLSPRCATSGALDLYAKHDPLQSPGGRT
jgi:bifunctional DNA-binding transcriptional regulator/antitoxin component of YhaV-PrlF toxin-antitoxin module